MDTNDIYPSSCNWKIRGCTQITSEVFPWVPSLVSVSTFNWLLAWIQYMFTSRTFVAIALQKYVNRLERWFLKLWNILYRVLQSYGNGRMEFVVFVTHLRHSNFRSTDAYETKVQTVSFYFTVWTCAHIVCFTILHFYHCAQFPQFQQTTICQVFPCMDSHNECLVLASVFVLICADCIWCPNAAPSWRPWALTYMAEKQLISKLTGQKNERSIAQNGYFEQNSLESLKSSEETP